MFKKSLFGIFLACQIFCAERIELMSTNGEKDTAVYAAVLEKYHIDATLQGIQPDHFGSDFKKSQTLFGKFFRKHVWDFPPSVPVESDVRKIILMNIPNHFYRDYSVAKLPKEKMVLFMWEPFIRLHKLYNKNLHQCFSRIYTWDDDLVDGVKYFKFYYPVMRPMVSDVVPFEKKKFCTLVSGNALKNPKHPERYPKELYSERRKAAEFFQQVGEEGFDLYGKGWDPNHYTSYRGSCKDKIETIKNYKFSICYENCYDVKGYITEKIFDCFHAGNVPIYWGASNVTDYIPKDCFIDRRDFTTLDELYAFLKKMTKAEYEGYIVRIRTFLQSEKAKLFSQENYEKIFLEAAGYSISISQPN